MLALQIRFAYMRWETGGRGGRVVSGLVINGAAGTSEFGQKAEWAWRRVLTVFIGAGLGEQWVGAA